MTLRPVRFDSSARRELRRAVDHYEAQVPGLGDEFAAEVERSIYLIASHVEAGSPHLAGTRRVLLRRFPYSVIYAAHSEQLIVLAIAHHRRKPEFWLRRL